VPDGSRDLPVEKAILLENGFDELHGIDWQKGCYMGQELTARTRYRGLVRKRLLPVEIDGPLPASGTPVMAGDKEAGEMRSGIDGLGLALLRLEHLDKGPLTAGGATLTPRKPDWVKFRNNSIDETGRLLMAARDFAISVSPPARCRRAAQCHHRHRRGGGRPSTLIRDEPAVVRTGVTMIWPGGRDIWNDYRFAGFHSFNGNGEMTGTIWLAEQGLLTGPIGITCTHCVGAVRDAICSYAVKLGIETPWHLPVVAETHDGWLSNAETFPVTEAMAHAASIPRRRAQWPRAMSAAARA
jgi:folate-binding protein YgfZ